MAPCGPMQISGLLVGLEVEVFELKRITTVCHCVVTMFAYLVRACLANTCKDYMKLWAAVEL